MDVLFVGDDLLARARVEEAAKRSGGTVTVVDLHDVVRTLEGGDAIVLVDLDRVGGGLVADLGEAAGRVRVIGYFSHVDEDLGNKARAVGVEAMPRGRFWRELDAILSGG